MKPYIGTLVSGDALTSSAHFNTFEEAQKWVAQYLGQAFNGYNYTGGGVYKCVLEGEKPVPSINWKEVK